MMMILNIFIVQLEKWDFLSLWRLSLIIHIMLIVETSQL